jgi:hypothetical protein
MVEAHLFINATDIGCLRCRNTGKTNGASQHVYEVIFVHPVYTFQFSVGHYREAGVVRLMARVFSRLADEMRAFFNVPHEKVQDGMIAVGDIPACYKDKFVEWMEGQTCGTTSDGQIGVFVTDLQRWVNMQVNGTNPGFD